MSAHISPSIGRKVWFWPQKDDIEEGVDFRGQLLDATIVFVHSDSVINLHVLDASGNAWKFESVVLLQETRPWDFPVRAAEWMPYQKDQAMKHHHSEGDASSAPVWNSFSQAQIPIR
jgi:hypothetical protein